MRAKGVLDVGRKPADGGNAGVLGVPLGVFAGIGRVLADDRVLEPGSFEGRLPRLDSSFDVWLQLLRHAAADVEHDRLDRLGKLGIGILLFQPPAGDVANGLGFVVAVICIVDKADAEEADPGVVFARLHGILRQPDHAVMDHGGDATRAGVLFGRRVGGQHPCFNILGEGLDLFNKGAVAVHLAGIQRTLGAELRHVLGEQAGDINDGHLVLAVRLDGKHFDDRRQVGGLHGS